MFDRTSQLPQLADLTLTHTLVIESTHGYEVHGPFGSNVPCTMSLVFKSTFNDQSMSIGLVGKLGHLSGLIRQYLLTVFIFKMYFLTNC